MRRILVVDDDLHTRLAIRTWLQRCGFRVAIDECLSEAEPHRRYAATLAAVATALSEQQGATTPPDISKERTATG